MLNFLKELIVDIFDKIRKTPVPASVKIVKIETRRIAKEARRAFKKYYKIVRDSLPNPADYIEFLKNKSRGQETNQNREGEE